MPSAQNAHRHWRGNWKLWNVDDTYGPDLSFTMQRERYLLKMDEDFGNESNSDPRRWIWRRWFRVWSYNHCPSLHSWYAIPFHDDPRRWKLDDDDDSTSTTNWRLTDLSYASSLPFERSDTSSLTSADAESGIFSHSRGIMLRSLFFSYLLI